MGTVLTQNSFSGGTPQPTTASVPKSLVSAGDETTFSSNNLSLPTGAMLNWNGQLTECSLKAVSGQFQGFGTVSFPIEECTVSFSQDVVQHKRPNVPGARVESTGFNPIIFKVKAIFLFAMQRGKGETWADLYPSAFNKVFSMLTDKTAPVMTFNHPTMGQFTVKPQSGSTNVSGQMRNGQVIEFELIQANEDTASTSNVTASTAFGTAQTAATLFDSTVTLLTPPPPDNVTKLNLTQLLQQITGIIGSTTLLINNADSLINNAIAQIKSAEDALDRLETAATSGLKMQLQRVKDGLHSLQNNKSTVTLRIPASGRVPAVPLASPPPGITPPSTPLLINPPNVVPPPTPNAAQIAAQIQSQLAANTNNQITTVNTSSNLGVYIVAHDMTLANVALVTKNTIDNLMRLNPGISKKPTLTVGTQVIYQLVQGPSPVQ